jgi:hypothetical protein
MSVAGRVTMEPRVPAALPLQQQQTTGQPFLTTCAQNVESSSNGSRAYYERV